MSITISQSNIPNGFQIDEDTPGSLFGLGYVVKGNGDINNDNYQDFVILAPSANTQTGRLYVVYGGTDPGTLSTINPDIIDLNSLNPFEVSVSLGDIDGNGYSDIIIGDSVANGGVQGKTYVIWGDTISSPIDVNSLGSNGFTIINSSNTSDFLGFSVSSGNINGDLSGSNAVDDVIIGDPLNDKAYAIFGNSSKYTGTFDISDPSNAPNISTISGAPNSSLGFSVSIGDIGGDNKDDVIIGAPNANGFNGEAYVVFGDAIPPDTTIDVGSLTGSNGFTFTTTSSLVQLGWKVSNAGDISGDGKEDFLVSEPGGSPTQRTYVVYGQSTFSASVDTTDITGGNGGPGFYFDGLNDDDLQSGISFETISPAGDINNDGIDDFLFAEPYDDDGFTDSGAVHLVYGRQGGFGSNPLDINSLAPQAGGKVDIGALSANDFTGFSVSDAGDVNGDLVDDFLIGVPGKAGFDGRVYVVLGKNTANPIPETTVDINPYGFPYPLIGENRTFIVSFDNVASGPGNVGYDPFVDLYLQTTGEDGKLTPSDFTDEDGLSLLQVKYILDQDISTAVVGGNSVIDGLNSVDIVFLGITPIERNIYLSSGQLKVDHPYAGTIDAPAGMNAGDTLYVIELPQDSFVPDQPVAELEVTVNISNYADYDIPLNIQTRGGFRLGGNPVLDPSPIDPILDTTYTSDDLTPLLYRIRKNYLGPDDETVTGPNFAKEYNITVDVAPGQTIQNLIIEDDLPDNMQYVQVIDANPSPYTINLPIPSNPGDDLEVEVSNVFGGPSSVDANLNFEFFIPRLDSGGTDVIDRTTGNAVTSIDLAQADIPIPPDPNPWQPLDPRDVPFSGPLVEPGAEHTLNDKSLAIQKSWSRVVDNKALGLSPGDVIEYSLDFQISDYFGFEDVIIEDQFSDGQVIDSSFVPTLTFNEQGTALSNVQFGSANYSYTNPPSTPPNTPGDITFDISAELFDQVSDSQLLGAGVDPAGGYLAIPMVGGTTGTVKFRTILQEDFANTFPSGDESVDNGDNFSNTATIEGTVLQVDVPNTPLAPYPTPTSQTDNSSAVFRLPRGRWQDFDVSVYQIKRNGSVIGTIGNYPNQAIVAPGDEVTYRIEYSLPFADIEDLRFQSYLPLPSFDVNTLDPSSLLPGGASSAPALGDIQYHIEDTFHVVTGNPATNPTPTITLDTVSNSILFDYGDFDEPGTATTPPDTKIDLLYTLEVGNQVTKDNLLLTNISYEREGSTNAGSRTFGQIAQLKLKSIPLNITKGAVIASEVTPTAPVFSDTVASPITFTAPGTGGTRFSGGAINSNYLTSNGLDSDLSGVGLQDVITFAIVVENIGTNGFTDLVIQDTLPTGLQIPSVGGLNLNVTDGAGSTISSTGSLFSAGGLILNTIGAFDPTSGSNVAVITFDLEVIGGEQFDNTATLESYGATPIVVNSTDTANIISFASPPTINTGLPNLQDQFNTFVGNSPPQAGQTFTANPLTFTDADIPYGDALDYRIIVQKDPPGVFPPSQTVYDSGIPLNLGSNPFESIDTSSLNFTFKPFLGSPFSGEYTVEIQVSDLDPDNQTTPFDVQESFIFNIALGTVINNYIAGATVFFDANKNGILDAGEVQTTTDEQGDFVWNDDLLALYDTDENGILDPSEGQIVAIGGINTATGLELDIPLTSVPSASVVTPLTSIVAKLVDQGNSVEEANELLTNAFSIPNDVDVNNFDPVAATNNDVANGAETYTQHTMATIVIGQIKALLSGASPDTPENDIADRIIQAIASEIELNTTLNFTDVTQIETIINDAATDIGVDVSSLVTGAAEVIVAANQEIAEALTNLSTAELEEAFAKVEKVALGETSTDLEEAGAGTKTIAEVVAENTGPSLEEQIANALVLSDDPTDISLSNDSVQENLPIGTEVGSFSTIDPNPGETHSYSLVPGEGDTDNDSFEIVDNRLQTTEIFDYEIQDAYEIRVQTADGNGGIYSEQFTINVDPDGPPTVNLDIDGNGETDALTDGILVIRYMFGFRGDVLIDGSIASNAERSTEAEIVAYLDEAVEVGMLDVDGNNMVDALTDGISIVRYLFGFTGDTLISGAIGPGATRTSASDIFNFLQSFDL